MKYKSTYTAIWDIEPNSTEWAESFEENAYNLVMAIMPPLFESLEDPLWKVKCFTKENDKGAVLIELKRL